MKLDILISTIDEGITNVENVILPKRKGVTYIVSHQYRDAKYKNIPKALTRDDVIVSHIPGQGVTKSRNHAIQLASGDIALFSDDDVTYTPEYFDTVIKTFQSNKDLDVALFKIKTPAGFPEYKKYPTEIEKLNKLPFSVGTIEIAIKINSIKDKYILFDERFGAGQPLLIGSDESIFVLDCLRKNLNVWFFPEYVVEHPYESSVKKYKKYDKRIVSVTGAYDARINGIKAIPKAIGGTLKILPDLIKNKKSPVSYLRERLSATLYILRTNKNNLKF